MRRPHPQSYLTFWYRGHVTKNCNISTFPRPMDSNLTGWRLRMRGPHLQSHLTHHYMVTWQIKNVISPLSQYLWNPNPPTKARDTSIHVTDQTNLSSLSQCTRSTNFAKWWLAEEDPTQHIMCYLDHVVTWQLSSR